MEKEIKNQLIRQIEKEFIKNNMFYILNFRVSTEKLFTNIFNIQKICQKINYVFDNKTFNNWNKVLNYLDQISLDNKKVHFHILDKKIKFENEKLIISIKVKNMELEENILWTFTLNPINRIF